MASYIVTLLVHNAEGNPGEWDWPALVQTDDAEVVELVDAEPVEDRATRGVTWTGEVTMDASRTTLMRCGQYLVRRSPTGRMTLAFRQQTWHSWGPPVQLHAAP